MQEEFDLLEIIKRIRVLSMLTNALFAKRKTVFVGFAEKFFIKVNKKGELIDDDKSKDALTAEQLQQLLLDFNPVENKEDVMLANYVAGRELSFDELFELFNDVKKRQRERNRCSHESLR